MKDLKTVENLHNFHFTDKADFFSPKWKERTIYLRQICFDTPEMQDTYFAIDKDTLELFIYFDNFGTKLNPRLIKLGKMPEKYTVAISYLAGIENAMLSILSQVDYDELKKIITTKDLKKYLGIYATPV